MKTLRRRTRQDTDPLTRTQLGAVHGEFERLGFGRADRAERLEISAAVAGYPGKLATTKDLTMGEAGRLIGVLRQCDDIADLIDPDESPPAGPPAAPWHEAVAAFAVALYQMSIKNGA
jgi:hypothetical protein